MKDSPRRVWQLSSRGFEERRFVKRLLTMATVTAATCMALTLSATPASADQRTATYPTKATCQAMDKVFSAMFPWRYYYCEQSLSPGVGWHLKWR